MSTDATENTVRQALAEEENKLGATHVPLHETSSSVCISLGLMIEGHTVSNSLTIAILIDEMYRHRVKYLLNGEDKDAPATIKEIQEKRTLVQNQLRQFRFLQAVYMPGVAARLRELGESRKGDVETERVLLPSDFSLKLCVAECISGVDAKEAVLREAQCHNALERVRSMQHTRQSVRSFRKRHIHGQRQSGRTMAIILRLKAKFDMALLTLRGDGKWTTSLRPLKGTDIHKLDSSSTFVVDRVKHRKTELKAGEEQYGSGSYVISWI